MLLIIVSCAKSEYNYPNNPNISTINGSPIDSINPQFILDSMIIGKSNIPLVLKKENNDQLNNVLHFAHEPILHNYFMGREVYRFFIDYKNDNYLIASISHKGDTYWISAKNVFIDQNGDYSMSVRTIDLTKEQWDIFNELWENAFGEKKSKKYIVQSDLDSLNDSVYFFVEEHKNKEYAYWAYSDLSESKQKLLKWIIANSRIGFNPDLI